MKTNFLLIATLLVFTACQNNEQPTKTSQEPVKTTDTETAPLPSWNDGETKEAIISFVNAVTNKAGADYVKPADRIATFDNDGTLWSEKPMYVQVLFALDRVKAMAPEHPEWKNKQPFKAVLENDMKALIASGEHGLLEIVAATHAGMSTEDFENIVSEWIASAKQPDPRFKDRLFSEMIFQPMLELMDYLRANDFQVFIVSGGGIEFMRPFADDTYGVASQNVVGSSIKVNYEYVDGKPVLMRLPELNFIDDKAGKPVGINEHIGKKPILAFGNSDGDKEMLEWSQSASSKTLQGLVHHTDSVREWSYGPGSPVGAFSNNLMHQADSSGWFIVDMKTDWKVIFSNEDSK